MLLSLQAKLNAEIKTFVMMPRKKFSSAYKLYCLISFFVLLLSDFYS